MNSLALVFSILVSGILSPNSIPVTPQDLINWKVGDESNYIVTGGSFGRLGTMRKFVSKDEGEAIWLTQDMTLMSQQQKAEVLIRKSDAKILKMIVNGKEQAVPDDKLEVADQEYTSITVPAGTFKCIHITGKIKGKKAEFWANPSATVMEGTLKQFTETGMIDITLELESFKKQN